MRYLLFCVLVTAFCAPALSKISLNTFGKSLDKYIKTGAGDNDFWDTLEAVKVRNKVNARNPTLEIDLLNGVSKQERVELTCVLCKEVADSVIGWFSSGYTRDEIVNMTTNLCVTVGIAAEHVCYGTVDSYADMFIWIGIEKNNTGDPLTSDDFCGMALYPDCPLEGPEYVWTLDLDFMGPKPPFQPALPPPTGAPTVHVLHLTDVHVDPNYLPGGNADCGDPNCCRADQGPPVNATGAGYWGDHRECDLPIHSFINLMDQAALSYPESDVAYVMFTGDIVDHGVWATSMQGNIDLFNLVFNEIRARYPNVPLLPVFGNHEPHPLNVYSTSDWNIPYSLSQEWLYQYAVDTWGTWLPGIGSTLMRGGYYSYAVRPDLLVVVLNNNVCYTYNWWLIYDSKDPGGQLVWLAQTLLQAEQQGQRVHILAHISSDSGSCFAPWKAEYLRILDRFENIISAQLYGHTHDDLMDVFYSKDDSSQANMVAFSGGSGTPDDGNPNYKVYTFEGIYSGSEYRILDAESWYYNLTEANLGGPDVLPNWKILYSFNSAYGTNSMLPSELDQLLYRMAADVSLQQQYYRFSVKAGDPSLQDGCDADCLKSEVCDIVSNTPGKCDELPWPVMSTTVVPSTLP